MQRTTRTFLTSAVVAFALAGGLTACTGSTDSGAGEDTKPGGATATGSAPPGKFRTLPEPCGAVSRDTLKELLPGATAASGSQDPGASPYEGEASETYDTDRRVGCSWTSATTLGSRQLSIDFERVVSYDSTVSDDRETEQLYAERADEAGVTASADPPDGEDPPQDGQGDRDGQAGEDAGPSESGGAPDGDRENGGAEGDEPGETRLPGSPSSEPSMPPRSLSGIGDAAFIDDELVTTESGRATHRDVTLVFRKANVLVTVEYSQSVADEYRTPDSAELQEQAQNVARQLAERFDDN